MMRFLRNKSWAVLYSIFLLALIVGNVATVSAQSGVGLSISPTNFEFSANPGESVSNVVKIYNPSDFQVQVKMEVDDFIPEGEEGQVALVPASESTYSLANWIEIEDETFTLDPLESKNVAFTIDLPVDAEPGGHYGTISAAVVSAGSDATGSSVSTKRAALLLMRVAGTIEEEARIESFTATHESDQGPVLFTVRFNNTGNVHVRPQGFVSITDFRGNQVAQVPLSEHNVIPGAIRKSDAQWNEKELFGRYTATVVTTYGQNGKKSLTETITFTIIPWEKVAIYASVILIPLLFILLFRKRIKKAVTAFVKS